jgi:hypothetical protein
MHRKTQLRGRLKIAPLGECETQQWAMKTACLRQSEASFDANSSPLAQTQTTTALLSLSTFLSQGFALALAKVYS